MLPWCRIKKRTGNAKLKGVDLGKITPSVKITIQREEDLRLPKPTIGRKIIK